jgi:hypothetical protein
MRKIVTLSMVAAAALVVSGCGDRVEQNATDNATHVDPLPTDNTSGTCGDGTVLNQNENCE